jgi:putative sigma-54 modulation protein
MELRIRSRGVELDEAERSHIERRVWFGLGRLSPHVRRVTAHFVDINGPRGGADKSCRIEVTMHPSGHVFVDDTDADLHTVVDRTIGRAARSVLRAVERSREVARTAPTPSRPRLAAIASGTDLDPRGWDLRITP